MRKQLFRRPRSSLVMPVDLCAETAKKSTMANVVASDVRLRKLRVNFQHRGGTEFRLKDAAFSALLARSVVTKTVAHEAVPRNSTPRSGRSQMRSADVKSA